MRDYSRSIQYYGPAYFGPTEVQAESFLFTTHGCPYQCVFCACPALFRGSYRAYAPERVVDEIEELVARGCHVFSFRDDTFCLERDRVIRICGDIVDRGLSISWFAQVRVDLLDEELVKHMRRAGCREAGFGVESGSPRVLRRLKKNINVEKVVEAVRWLKSWGILPAAYFMYGHPDETREDLEQTIRLIRQVIAEGGVVHWPMAAVPYPGTELLRYAREGGLLCDSELVDYRTEVVADRAPCYVPPGLDESDYRAYLSAVHDSWRTSVRRMGGLRWRLAPWQTFFYYCRKATSPKAWQQHISRMRRSRQIKAAASPQRAFPEQ